MLEGDESMQSPGEVDELVEVIERVMNSVYTATNHEVSNFNKNKFENE